MNRKLFLALAISLLLVGSAQADLQLVDTGQPATTTGGMSLKYPQTLYAQFVLKKPSTITSIHGWMNVTNAGPPAGLVVQIYQDNGDVPGTLLFNVLISSISGTGAAWLGASSLNWSLPVGTYWVGFMGAMIGYPHGFDGTMPGPAPAPLGKEGYSNVGTGTPFTRADDMDIGVRINGNPITNPNLLLLLGQ